MVMEDREYDRNKSRHDKDVRLVQKIKPAEIEYYGKDKDTLKISFSVKIIKEGYYGVYFSKDLKHYLYKLNIYPAKVDLNKLYTISDPSVNISNINLSDMLVESIV
jgi:hypothetical protein